MRVFAAAERGTLHRRVIAALQRHLVPGVQDAPFFSLIFAFLVELLLRGLEY